MQKIVQTKWAKKPSSFAIKLLFSQILCKGSTKSAHKKIITQNFDFQPTPILPINPINPILPINPITPPIKKSPQRERRWGLLSRFFFKKLLHENLLHLAIACTNNVDTLLE